MPRSLMLLLACLAACHPPELTAVHQLTATPSALHFDDTAGTAELSFVLRNTGRESEAVTLTVPAPFSVTPAQGTLKSGEALTVQVTFAPTGSGAFHQTVLASSLEAMAAVDVTGATPCAPASPCHAVSHDPKTGACVEQPVTNGTACDDPCLTQASCQSGRCVGDAVSCDDQNACTLDACERGTGCVHVDTTSSCPADGCHTATCDPLSGCGTTERNDGDDCGSDDCTVRACVAGQCQGRPVTDGITCGAASVCQGTGQCVAGACQRPPPVPLARQWTRNIPDDAGTRLWSALMADEADNLHWLECSDLPMPYCEHVSVTASGATRFRTKLSGVIYVGEPVTTTRDLLVAGEDWRLAATHLSTGALAWTRDMTSDLVLASPSCPGSPQTQANPRLTALADDGHGGLYAQFQAQACGGYWAGAWTVRLDAQTGKTIWVRPYLGNWLSCSQSYGGGSIFSDEQGDALVLEGWSECAQYGNGVKPRVVAYALDGTVVWSMPWTFGHHLEATFKGALEDEAGTVFSVADGGSSISAGFTRPPYGVEALLGDRGSFFERGTIGSYGFAISRVDPHGALKWTLRLDGGSNMLVGQSPTLTARDTLLFTLTSDWGATTSQTSLYEVDADGGLEVCPLPLASSEFIGQAVLLSSGRWVGVRWGSWFDIDAYDLAARPPPHGWVSPGGGAAHGNRPR